MNNHITNTKVNSAFHLYGVGKSSTYRPVWLGLRRGYVCLCRVASNTVWSHMAGDAP